MTSVASSWFYLFIDGSQVTRWRVDHVIGPPHLWALSNISLLLTLDQRSCAIFLTLTAGFRYYRYLILLGTISATITFYAFNCKADCVIMMIFKFSSKASKWCTICSDLSIYLLALQLVSFGPFYWFRMMSQRIPALYLKRKMHKSNNESKHEGISWGYSSRKKKVCFNGNIGQIIISKCVFFQITGIDNVVNSFLHKSKLQQKSIFYFVCTAALLCQHRSRVIIV